MIDNAADEAIAGYADEILVTLHDDGSLSVADNGRGMPVDMHAKEKRVRASRSSSRACTPAPSSRTRTTASPAACTASASRWSTRSRRSCEVWVRARRQRVLRWRFADGKKKSELKVVGTVGKRNTGTTVRFWPDPKFFDSPKFSVPRLKHVHARQGGALPEAAHPLRQRGGPDGQRGVVLRGRPQGLPDSRARRRPDACPRARSSATSTARSEEVDWAVVWLAEEDGDVGAARATST